MLQGKSVLIVDDEPEIRGMIQDYLEGRGYAVLTAWNADDALRLLRRHPETELIVTDIVMPGSMSGFDLATAARRLQPGLKVIYMSGYAAAKMIADSMPEVPVILAKPFWFEHLAQVVGAALHGKPPALPRGGDDKRPAA